MNQLIKIIILGIIQGLTEWLPISSTGHLRLAQQFLGLDTPILLDVILHVGTLTVVLLFFKNDVKTILTALAHLDFKTEHGQFIPLIFVGTIPTVLIGLIFGDFIEDRFKTALPIATAFILCGTMLYISRTGKEETNTVSYTAALLIGTAQGIAIIPGISRSGTTIAIALLLGLRREEAFKFSFLLSIPAIIGALGLTLYTQTEELATAGFGFIEISIGVVIAVFVGYFALKLLWTILAKRKFHTFAFYCWLLGLALIALSMGIF